MLARAFVRPARRLAAPAVRWAHGPSGTGGGPPGDDLSDLPWADADDELVDASPHSGAKPPPGSGGSDSSAAPALSLERLAALVSPEREAGGRAASRAGPAARGRRRSEVLDAIESASMSELSRLVESVAEEAAQPPELHLPARAAQHVLFDPRVRTPPWAQVRARRRSRPRVALRGRHPSRGHGEEAGPGWEESGALPHPASAARRCPLRSSPRRRST